MTEVGVIARLTWSAEAISVVGADCCAPYGARNDRGGGGARNDGSGVTDMAIPMMGVFGSGRAGKERSSGESED